MTAFTTQRAGNWSDTTTSSPWYVSGGTPCPIPGNGDTFTQNHNLTIDVNTTVGNSPAPAATVGSVAAAVTLTVATGVTFRLRGNLRLDASGSSLVLNAGSTLVIDSSQASPTSTIYLVRPSVGATRVIFNGTSGSHCTVSSDAGGGNGRIATSQGGTGVTATYTDFTRVGDASNTGFLEQPSSTTSPVSFDHCTFTSCGKASFTVDQTGTCSITNCVWSSTLGTRTLGVSGTAFTSGTRLVSGNVFDKAVDFFGAVAFTVTGNYFALGVAMTAGAWADFRGNLLRMTASGGLSVAGSMTNNYILADAANDNQHFINMAPDGSYTYDGLIFDAPSTVQTTDQGDCMLTGGSVSPQTFTIQNCIVLPIASGAYAGKAVGVLVTYGTSANLTGTVLHNTSCSSKGVVVGEGPAALAGALASVKDNLVWSTISKGAAILSDINATQTQDVVAPANLDYNGKFNPIDAAGTNSIAGVNGKFSTTPNGHDVTGDPQFVDRTRYIGSWGTTKGADGSVAGALALIAADPSLIYSASDMTTLWQWVRGGFAPTNPAYKGTAHDGTDIGAVPVVLLAGGPVVGSVIAGNPIVGSAIVGKH